MEKEDRGQAGTQEKQGMQGAPFADLGRWSGTTVGGAGSDRTLWCLVWVTATEANTGTADASDTKSVA